MHKLLQRQLKKLYGGLHRVPGNLQALLEQVNQTYEQADADRKLLERSLDLTSQELLGANAELRRDQQALEKRVRERTADLLRLNASLEREIAERKEAENRLLHSQKMEAVGRLAGGVAHDFNNLLTAILGYAELQRGVLEDGHDARQHAEEIRQAAKRGARLTQQLLAFSRSQVLEPRVLSINQVVAEMENLLRRVIGEDIVLVTRFGQDLGAVRADATQVEQVLLNLAVNARDAMPTGGELMIETYNVDVEPGDARIRAGLAPGPYVVLVVADSGVGIDHEIRNRIFEPFFTTKEGTGTGLGLSTVYGIVQQSGGHIDVSSRPGKGTRFAVLLPAVAGEPVEPEADVVLDGVPPGTETVLLAEDEPAVRSFLATLLRRLGYSVLTAAHGEEALRVAEEAGEPIQVLLSDVVMPRLNGVELARRLCQTTPDLKVILMSGHTGHGTDGSELEDLEVDFLQKPFSANELGRKLRQVLEGDPVAKRAAG